MKKSISLLCFSILASSATINSMEYKEKKTSRGSGATQTAALTELEKSQVVSIVPETTGLGFWRSAQNLIWSEEDNFFADLQNDRYDPKNASHPRCLDKTLHAYVNKDNDTQLTATVEICRSKYGEVITLQHPTAIKAHNYLVKQQKEKEKKLAEHLIHQDKKNKEEINMSLTLLKETMNQLVNNINKQTQEQKNQQVVDTKQEADEIRRLKHARLSLRKLSRQNNQTTPDGYCSDDEKKDTNAAINDYTDTHILEKIKLRQSLDETTKKRQAIVAKLIALNAQIQEIQSLPQ